MELYGLMIFKEGSYGNFEKKDERVCAIMLYLWIENGKFKNKGEIIQILLKFGVCNFIQNEW